MQHTIAIDLGGTIIKIGLLNSGQLIDRREIKAQSASGLLPQLPELEIAINGLLESNKIHREDVSGIGFSFVTMIHAFDPEIIILSGGIMKSADVFLPVLQEKVNTLAWTPWGKVQLKKAKFSESAALYGADYLVRTSLSRK